MVYILLPMKKITKRKIDHIKLVKEASILEGNNLPDPRFFYEPLLGIHPSEEVFTNCHYPIWISSMTGGSKISKNLNKNLAKVAKSFNFLGMGLGSMRILLEDLLANNDINKNKYYQDFNLRDDIGNKQLLYGNIGIAQIELLNRIGAVHLIGELVKEFNLDGIFIHVNPLQEYMQDGGDKITVPPIVSLKNFLEKCQYKIGVKEVGQGFGPESMKKLLDLPLEMVEFSSFGGTNFTKLELLRKNHELISHPLVSVGHTKSQMIAFFLMALKELKDSKKLKCKNFIISGGIKDMVEGYYYRELILNGVEGINANLRDELNVSIGFAAKLLDQATNYSKLEKFVKDEINNFEMSKRFLRIGKN